MTIEQAIEQLALDISHENDHLIFLPPNAMGNIWMIWRNNDKGDRFYYGRTLKAALMSMMNHDKVQLQTLSELSEDTTRLDKIGKLCARLERGFSIKMYDPSLDPAYETHTWCVQLDGRGIVVVAEEFAQAVEWFEDELVELIHEALGE